MKYLTLLLMSAILVLSVQDTNAQPVRILPLGDSITQSNSSHYSYRYNLWKKLIDAGVDFDYVGSMTTNYGGNPAWPTYQGQSFDPDHEGHWGWEADLLLGQLPGWLQGYTPDLVLMHAGTNDVLHSHTQASTVVELKQIIDTLRIDNPVVTIIIAKLIPTLSGEGGGNAGIIALNATIDGIAAEKNTPASPVVVVDQYEGFDRYADLFDAYHPDESGEEKMAQKWFDAIIPLLDAPPTWNTDPVNEIDAIEGRVYDSTLADDATDPDGGSLVFSKLTGPSWLDVAADGTLSGVPGNSDAEAGINSFTVRAMTGAGTYADAGLQIAVENTFTGELGLTDFAGLATRWLDSGCVDSPPCGGADLTGEGVVDIDDLKEFSWMWLIETDLVSHWSFDDASGTTLTDDFGPNDGTLMNMDDFDWVSGQSGTALEFDGVDDTVEIPNVAALNINGNSGSISFWLKSDTASQGTQIISKRADAVPFAQYSIGLSAGDSYYWDAGSKITFLFREDTGIEKGGYTTADIDFSDWTHVAVVLDRTAGTVYVYIDGVLVPVTLDHDDALPAITNSSPLYIGGNPNALDLFQGLVDDIRIYDRALSLSEISAIAQ